MIGPSNIIEPTKVHPMQEMENEGIISEECGGSRCKRIERGEKLKGERGYNLTRSVPDYIQTWLTLFSVSHDPK